MRLRLQLAQARGPWLSYEAKGDGSGQRSGSSSPLWTFDAGGPAGRLKIELAECDLPTTNFGCSTSLLVNVRDQAGSTASKGLLRWFHPSTRAESPRPNSYPAAEETGLIIPLGEWVSPTGLQGCGNLAGTYQNCG